MLSRPSVVLLVAALLAAPARAAEPPTPQHVQAAVDAVRADPNLGGMKTERTLRWREDDAPDRRRDTEPAAPWLVELTRWIAESGRLLVWLLGALAVALLVVLARRWIRMRADTLPARPLHLPSHVHDLDIRPESLPDDIASAVRALWLRGEQRAALSLLYRGALSRLVHEHAVPIRAASTEGECVALAERVLSPPAAAFFADLVGAWRMAVYGARTPESSGVMALCEQFDTRLPRRATANAR